MNQTEQIERITPLEAAAKAIFCLQRQITERNERIEKLETVTRGNEETITVLIDHVALAIERIKKLEAATRGLTAIETTVALGHRVERLETALLDVARCLIDGKVDMAAPMPDELHGHRILGSDSVQTMVEVYHRLKGEIK